MQVTAPATTNLYWEGEAEALDEEEADVAAPSDTLLALQVLRAQLRTGPQVLAWWGRSTLPDGFAPRQLRLVTRSGRRSQSDTAQPGICPGA